MTCSEWHAHAIIFKIATQDVMVGKWPHCLSKDRKGKANSFDEKHSERVLERLLATPVKVCVCECECVMKDGGLWFRFLCFLPLFPGLGSFISIDSFNHNGTQRSNPFQRLTLNESSKHGVVLVSENLSPQVFPISNTIVQLSLKPSHIFGVCVCSVPKWFGNRL